MSAANHTRRIWLASLALLGALAIASGGLPISLSALNLSDLVHSGLIVYGGRTVFGGSGSGVGQFNEPSGVAVNDSSGDIYVYDAGNRRVEWFDAIGSKFEGQLNGSGSPTGQFVLPASISEHAAHGTLFNIAVDNDPSSPSTGDVYVVDPGHNVVDKFSAGGTYLSQLTGFKAPIFGVAVDTSGNVWIAEEGSEVGESHGPVQEFDNSLTNKHVTELPSLEGLRSPSIAVDSEQNLYLLRGEPNAVKFSKTGATLIPQLTVCGCGKALAFDTTANKLLFDEGSSVAVYPGSAEAFSAPAEAVPDISSSYGVAVNAATHDLYASQREDNTVAKYELVSVPDVTTLSATEHRTSAKLEGEVNPEGEAVTSCQFEYGTDTSYGHTAPCEQAPGSGTSPVPVSAEVTGLTAQTNYHYRLVAAHSQGPRAGEDHEFTTLPAVENLLTEAAIGVTGTTATLQGSFENESGTSYQFEFNTIGSPPTTTMPENAGSASLEHVSTELTGLTPNAIYLYHIVAKNAFGQTIGGFGLFKTQVVAPAIAGSPTASFVASQSADLNATINPEHTTTNYHFEYGPCPTLAGCANIQSTAVESSAVFGQVGAVAEIVGLAPATTYTYRLVGVNEFEEAGETHHETVIGPEGLFTTGLAPAPRAETGAYGAVMPTGAIISGAVDPDGLPATYSFELGVYNGAATQYGVVFSGSAGSGSVPLEETIPLAGLQPGTTYAYRIAISSGYIDSASHTIQGQPATFTTSGLPAVLVPPPLLTQLPIPHVAFPKAGSKPKKKKAKAAPKKRHKKKTGKGKKAK
jgi:NHL repeat